MKEENTDIEKLTALLRSVVWDYDISGEDLVEIFLFNKTGHSLSKTDLEARILGYYSWHQIIGVLGYHKSIELLNDDAIARIFPKSYQARLYGLRNILSEKAVSTSG